MSKVERLHCWVSRICEEYCEDEGVLLADGFESAFIGLARRFNTIVALYDRKKCIEALVSEHGMGLTGAEEYFSFNVEGACVGDAAPIFLLERKEESG